MEVKEELQGESELPATGEYEWGDEANEVENEDEAAQLMTPAQSQEYIRSSTR